MYDFSFNSINPHFFVYKEANPPNIIQNYFVFSSNTNKEEVKSSFQIERQIVRNSKVIAEEDEKSENDMRQSFKRTSDTIESNLELSD